MAHSKMTREEYEEAKNELRLQYEAGEFDCGQDDDDLPTSLPSLRDQLTEHQVSSVRGGPVQDKCEARSCFSRTCFAAGVNVSNDLHSVSDMDAKKVVEMSKLKGFKVYFVAYGKTDKRNHIELVPGHAANASTRLEPFSEPHTSHRTVVCTTMQHFFNKSNEWAEYHFFSGDGFGGDVTLPSQERVRRGDQGRAQSIAGDSVHGGQSNVSSGVTRARRRVVPSKSSALSGIVSKNYRTSNAIMFNNADELFQDKVSREYAQEIVEELFEVWGVPLDQPEAAKYAEDLLWMFLITVTASNKADYNRVFDVPVRQVVRNGDSVSSIEADFSKLSLLLESKFGVTRRQFARGVADDLRAFLRHDENQAILPQLAVRVGCESMMAYLAFDGSTHCSNMTTREVTFTKTLESRNLFERDDVVAQGASDKLMQGMSGGVRSVAPR